MIKNIIYSFFIAFVLFGAYVEINPQMTNIWWRINADNNKEIVISNLFALMLAPFQYLFYWDFNAWDINFYIWWIILYIILETKLKIQEDNNKKLKIK
jgi:hypothetical protein